MEKILDWLETIELRSPYLQEVTFEKELAKPDSPVYTTDIFHPIELDGNVLKRFTPHTKKLSKSYLLGFEVLFDLAVKSHGEEEAKITATDFQNIQNLVGEFLDFQDMDFLLAVCNTILKTLNKRDVKYYKVGWSKNYLIIIGC